MSEREQWIHDGKDRLDYALSGDVCRPDLKPEDTGETGAIGRWEPAAS